MRKISKMIKQNIINTPKSVLILILAIIIINTYAIVVDIKWTFLGSWCFSIYLILLGIENSIRRKNEIYFIIGIIGAIIFFYIGLEYL